MSNSSPSPQPDQQEQAINESDVVSEASLSLNQETLNQPNPPPPTSAPSPPSPSTPPPPLDPGYNSPDEEEDDDDEEGGEIDEGQEQETPAISSGASPHMDSPITVHHVSASDVTLPSPSPGSNTRRNATGKRKKGKGKGKPNIKKQQAIEEKLRSLMVKLKPIPFKPGKIPDFSKHEKLLMKLGLWDFVHIDLDRNVRVDLIAQLIASYEPKNRASKVQDYRISVSRADFARAFKLPVKKKGNNNAGGAVDVDLECETLSDDSIGFVRVLVDEWVLLHEDNDMWMMPSEVAVLYKMIEDGHPEKVDWGSLFWFMVEKELKRGGQLEDCYYASHLQYLIKFQRKELFFDIKDEIYEEVNPLNEEGVCLMEGPSTELTLGQDSEKEDEEERMIVNDVDKYKENDCNEEEHETEEQEEVEDEQEQGQWLLNGQNRLGEHFMQRCSSGNAEMFERFEEEKEDEEEMDEDEDEGVNKFHIFPSEETLEGEEDGLTGNLTGNFIQTMESNQMDFDHHHHPKEDHLCNQPSVDIGSTPSFFNSAGKRAIEHDSNDINKKLRINDSWVHNNTKQLDLGMSLELIQNTTEQARLLYEEKERATHQSNMHQQLLLSELERRDSIIRKKDEEIYRFEREMVLMESVLDGYRKALKETQRAFSEYREKARVQEEPTYKDTGLGGLMLTSSEIEKRRKIQVEEEDKNLRLMFEQKLKEMENKVGGQFEKYAKEVSCLDNKLALFCGDVKGMMKEFEEWKMKKTNEVEVDDEGVKEEREKSFEEWKMKKTNKVKVDDEGVKGGEPVANPESEEEIDEVEEEIDEVEEE